MHSVLCDPGGAAPEAVPEQERVPAAGSCRVAEPGRAPASGAALLKSRLGTVNLHWAGDMSLLGGIASMPEDVHRRLIELMSQAGPLSLSPGL